jgi:hypothetical protein
MAVQIVHSSWSANADAGARAAARRLSLSGPALSSSAQPARLPWLGRHGSARRVSPPQVLAAANRAAGQVGAGHSPTRTWPSLVSVAICLSSESASLYGDVTYGVALDTDREQGGTYCALFEGHDALPGGSSDSTSCVSSNLWTSRASRSVRATSRVRISPLARHGGRGRTRSASWPLCPLPRGCHSLGGLGGDHSWYLQIPTGY